MSFAYQHISHKDPHQQAKWIHLFYLLKFHGIKGYLGAFLSDYVKDVINGTSKPQRFDLYIARNEIGSIVGWAVLGLTNHVVDTWVLPQHRRKGVGSGLIQKIRNTHGDTKVISSWKGYKGYDKFFQTNFIHEVIATDQPDRIFKDANKSGKLKVAAAYRKHKANANN